MTLLDAHVRHAEVVLGCAELSATLRFFTETLGFRVDMIHPADDPRVAVVSAYGLRVRLERGVDTAAASIRLVCRYPEDVANGATELTAPNGTRVTLVPSDPPIAIAPLRPSFTVSRQRDAVAVEGRAGMRYRDLLPDRQGGRFIASHIEIVDGGPVPDYVHFHAVAFQMIYCQKGWVRVVYEDQGEPFVLKAGDCALQPPRIRHRVLECSPNLEVIEVSAPADHETYADHELPLPTSQRRETREFEGQRFVRHHVDAAVWTPSGSEGFEQRELGIAVATRGLAGARVVRGREGATRSLMHDGDLLFGFVLAGAGVLQGGDRHVETLVEGDAFSIPRGEGRSVRAVSPSFELLEVAVAALG